jgi:hypothetical protein
MNIGYTYRVIEEEIIASAGGLYKGSCKPTNNAAQICADLNNATMDGEELSKIDELWGLIWTY